MCVPMQDFGTMMPDPTTGTIYRDTPEMKSEREKRLFTGMVRNAIIMRNPLKPVKILKKVL